MVAKKPRKPRSKPQAVPAGESQFRSLIETALDVVVVLNYDGTIRYTSPSVQRITGYSPMELLGENAFPYIHEDDTGQEFEVFKAVVSDPGRDTVGEPHSFRFRHKDGHWVVLESVSTKLPEGPEPPGIVVNARDVTGLRQANETMRQMAVRERRSAQETEVIAEVGRIIRSTLNIEEVFELFATEVSRLISFDMIAASIVDHSQRTTTLRYRAGPEEYRRNLQSTVPFKGSVTGEVVASGKPVLVRGTSHEEIRQRFIFLSESHQGGVLSWLGIPMVNRGVTIGALLLFSSDPQAFSDQDIALAGWVSYQIAGAIDNAGLFDGLKIAEADLASSVIERSEAASQNEVIAEIGRIISSTLDIEEVYEPFVGQVRNLIKFDGLSICAADRYGGPSRIAHIAGADTLGLSVGSPVPNEGSITGEVGKLKHSITVQGLSEAELKEEFPVAVISYRSGARSWLCAPLVNSGEFVGTLMIHSMKKEAFTERDAGLAQRVGDQIAGATGSARLFADLKKAETDLAGSMIERSESASQNEVIAEIGRIISSTLNIEEVLEPFADQVRKLIGFDVLAFCIMDREGRMGRIAHRVGDDRVGYSTGSLVPINGSIAGEVARLEHSIIVQGLTQKKLKERFPSTILSYQGDVRSWLCTPLINGGEFVGTLLMLSTTENAFSTGDAELAQRVGIQIAGAIDSVRLYEDLKKVETALNDSVNRNQMILETAHDAFVGIDDQGQVIAWNSQAEVTFGWAAGEAMQRTLSDLIIPPRFARQHLSGIKNFLATGKGPVINQRIEIVAQHRDGHEFPVELTISPLKLGDRHIFNAFIRDITERKESEDALRLSEERFRAVYNNAANGIGTRTLDGTSKNLNPAFLNMVGYTMDEIRELESEPGTLYDVKYLEIENEMYARALQGEDIPPYEKEYIRKDGTTVFTEVRASLERDDEGNPIGIVAVVTDISERQKLEQEIAQYTKTLEQANEELQ